MCFGGVMSNKKKHTRAEISKLVDDAVAAKGRVDRARATTASPKPETCNADVSKLPAALEHLREKPIWVNWRWVLQKGKWTKPPYRVDNPDIKASTSDPATWGAYELAVKQVLADKADGIGFAVKGSGIGGINLDHCCDLETLEITPWAQEYLDQFPDAYVEVTPSGKGLRILGTSELEGFAPKFESVNGGANVDLFSNSNDYLTLSCNEISDCSALPPIGDAMKAIAAKLGEAKRNGKDEIEKLLEAPGAKPPAAASALYYFHDCETIVSKEWILKGLIARGEASSWIAPPGAGKSGLLTAIAVHVGAQQDFHGFRSKGVCGVLYLAFERFLHTRRRMTAYARRGFKNLPICIRPGIINLMDPKCVEVITAAMKEAEAHFSVPIGLVIIDTFAKGMAAGGGNESEAKDQGRCLGHLQMLRDMTGCHTAIIHHTGKDVSKGARGSNAQVCDVDVEFTISGDDGTRSLKVTKANDQPEGKVMAFTIKSEVLGQDEDGDEITVGIVAEADPVKRAAAAKEWAGKTVRLRDAINEVLSDDQGFDHHIPRGPTVKAVYVDDVQAIYRKTVVAVNPEPERPHRQADDALRRDIERAAAVRLISSHNIGQRGIIWMV